MRHFQFLEKGPYNREGTVDRNLRVIVQTFCFFVFHGNKMYGKSSLESNWPEPWSFVGAVVCGVARQTVTQALVMDRVGSHGFAAARQRYG